MTRLIFWMLVGAAAVAVGLIAYGLAGDEPVAEELGEDIAEKVIEAAI